MRVVIVIPTYNEISNIGMMMSALSEEFRLYPHYDWHVLVVDGNSPDGTGNAVLEYGKSDPRFHLLEETEKKGLGAAYLAGFREAMGNLHADALVEMDADFQHNPKDVIRLVKELENGSDYVIGSRFVSGGRLPKDWALYRKLLSVGGSLFSKIVLGVFNVNDFTSGFKCSRVEGFVNKLDFTKVLSAGFAYKIDLLYKMYLAGARIKEVPIEFGLRDRGDSKMEKSNFLDSFKVVLLLRVGKSKSFFKFAIVGVTGLFVDAILFNVLRIAFGASTYAAPIAGALAMLTTFLLNNFWSFGERKILDRSKQVYSMLLYVLSSSVPILVRTKLVFIFTSSFGDTFLVSNAAFLLGIIFGLIWNYTVYSRIIWKRT